MTHFCEAIKKIFEWYFSSRAPARICGCARTHPYTPTLPTVRVCI